MLKGTPLDRIMDRKNDGLVLDSNGVLLGDDACVFRMSEQIILQYTIMYDI